MNDGYLLADCVIDYLAKLGFIHAADWKHETKELYYTASFVVVGTRASTVSFEIIKSIIRLLEKRFSKDFGIIFSECVLQ
jgi:hypothetical protein